MILFQEDYEEDVPEEIHGHRVDVYWNSRKKRFSVRDLDTRKVVAHLHNFEMTDVDFEISEAGRQRVIKNGQKNVHAFMRGYLEHKDRFEHERFYNDIDEPYIKRSLTYNPYKNSTFVDEFGISQYSAMNVLFDTLDNKPVVEAIYYIPRE